MRQQKFISFLRQKIKLRSILSWKLLTILPQLFSGRLMITKTVLSNLKKKTGSPKLSPEFLQMKCLKLQSLIWKPALFIIIASRATQINFLNSELLAKTEKISHSPCSATIELIPINLKKSPPPPLNLTSISLFIQAI